MADSWVQQSQNLMDAWSEAQARLWGDWADMAVKLGTHSAPTAGTWFEQWQTMARRGLDAWGPDTDGAARQVVERMFAGEQMFLQTVEMTLGMLRIVAPKIETGDDWVELLRRYMDQLKEDALQGRVNWLRPEGLAGAAGDVSELWRLYMAETERFMGPWVKGLQRNVVHMGEAARGDTGAMGKLLVSSMDAFEATFGRIVSAPAVGQTRETTEMLARGFDAWAEMNRASVEFQNDILNQGVKAWEDVIQELVDMGERGEKVTTLHQLFDLYVETAEKRYYNLFSTDAFAEMQGRLVNATMEFKKRQRELLDETMTELDMPGRTEVDQIHRHVHELRREVRYMKRDLALLQTELEEAQAALKAQDSQLESKAAGQAVETAQSPAAPPAKSRARKSPAKAPTKGEAQDAEAKDRSARRGPTKAKGAGPKGDGGGSKAGGKEE